MDVRILSWTVSVITGILITGTGVHFFRCNTNATVVKYDEHSIFNYYCPVRTNNYDIILSVPVATAFPQEELNIWGQPPNSDSNTTISRLHQHNIYKDRITLSGFSSGGTFAQQLQISYSSLFSGIATFSHGTFLLRTQTSPYIIRCGPGTGLEAEYDDACTIISANRTYDPELALADIRDYERQGLIENTRNLRNKRLYVYAGTQSAFFDLDLSLAVVRIYEPLILNLGAIKTRVQDATQLLPTSNFGAPCREPASTDTFFLGNCGFSGAYEAVRFLLGDFVRNPPEGIRANLENLRAFDQTEFLSGIEGNHFMDDVGYIFIPTNCYLRPCFLHFYFHGCLTGREYNGTSHLVNSGYLELAESNDLIIVAPQAVGSQENTIGCWDTYGLTGRLYATQRGAQVTVVRKILARILGEDKNHGIRQNNAGQSPSLSFEDNPFKNMVKFPKSFGSYQ